jgi:predicted CoA-binding protein
MMGFENPAREHIKELLVAARNIAVVGLSDKPDRVSYMVAEAMQKKGYRIIPVNPNAKFILGEVCYPWIFLSLSISSMCSGGVIK